MWTLHLTKKKSVLFFLSRIWLLDALKRIAKIFPKRLLFKLIQKPGLKFNLGLVLIGLQTTRPDQFILWSDWEYYFSPLDWMTVHHKVPPEVHLTNCLYMYSMHIYQLVLLTCMRSNDKHCYNLKGSFSWKSRPNWEQNFLSHSFPN